MRPPNPTETEEGLRLAGLTGLKKKMEEMLHDKAKEAMRMAFKQAARLCDDLGCRRCAKEIRKLRKWLKKDGPPRREPKSGRGSEPEPTL